MLGHSSSFSLAGEEYDVSPYDSTKDILQVISSEAQALVRITRRSELA